MINLYENEAGERFYEEMLRNLPEGYTKKMVKNFIHDLYSMKVKSFTGIDENTISIDGKITGDYAHVGSFKQKFPEYTLNWEIFKTDSKEMIKAGFKYFAFLPYHQHDKNSVRHCHFRYGNENFDFLITDPSVQSWWPTVYSPATIDEAKAIEQMTTPKIARMMAGMMQKSNK